MPGMQVTDEECPGAGKCHGCMCWCNRCGDVDLVCDYPECQRHHCYSCKQLLGKDDHDDLCSLCRTCSIAAINDDQIREFEKLIGCRNDVYGPLFGTAADLSRADNIARDLDANPVPYGNQTADFIGWHDRRSSTRHVR